MRRSAGETDLRVFIDLFVLPPVTETRSMDGGSVDFLSLSKAKVFRFSFCLAFAPLSFPVALTGSPASLVVSFVIFRVNLHQCWLWQIRDWAERSGLPIWYVP